MFGAEKFEVLGFKVHVACPEVPVNGGLDAHRIVSPQIPEPGPKTQILWTKTSRNTNGHHTKELNTDPNR